MQVEIRHSPASGVARCILQPNEAIKVQPGAMMAQSLGVTIEGKMSGGLLGGLGRMMSGENFFQSTFTAPNTGGWVDVIPNIIGDVFAFNVEANNPFMMNKGAWLANDGNLKIGPDASISSMFAGEGLVVLKTSGSGTLVGASAGAIDVISLKQGEGLTIDTGHLVAWESSVQLRTRKAGGIISSITSKEGLVVDVYGPGDVVMQTRVAPVIVNA